MRNKRGHSPRTFNFETERSSVKMSDLTTLGDRKNVYVKMLKELNVEFLERSM